MNPAIGIDLGTTNTVVGVQIDDSGPDILEVLQPVYQLSALEGQKWIKSAVLFSSADSAVVGAFAASKLYSFRSIKSKMGTRWRVRHPFAKEMLTAAYISAHILKLAKQAVARRFPQWDGAALITVPASFNSEQRGDTLKAAKMAGFAKVNLLDEPTAAFYYHFDRFRDAQAFDEKQTILVFDFGGGTLDVSIIEVQQNGPTMIIDTIGRSRYTNLGGDDIDIDIAAAMLACWKLEHGETMLPYDVTQLCKLFLERASAYKEEVESYLKDGRDPPVFVIDRDIPSKDGTKTLKVTLRRNLSRSQYEEIAGRYFREKSGLNIYRPIGEAVAVARDIRPGFSDRDLNLILYTGGASQMLGVRAALDCRFAPKRCLPVSESEPCNTVALGAAACRYDEMYRNHSVKMTKRLLENIFTRTGEDQGYVRLVPLETVPSETFQDAGVELHTLRPLIRLVHPLFRGVSMTDQQLSPIGDLDMNVGTVIAKGTPYRIAYRVTPDMTVEFKVTFRTPQGPHEQIVRVDPGIDEPGTASMKNLCTINRLQPAE